jgi:hypothetical protein
MSKHTAHGTAQHRHRRVSARYTLWCRATYSTWVLYVPQLLSTRCVLCTLCSVLFAVIAVIPGCCSVSPGSSGKVAVSLFTNFSILGNSRRTRDELRLNGYFKVSEDLAILAAARVGDGDGIAVTVVAAHVCTCL